MLDAIKVDTEAIETAVELSVSRTSVNETTSRDLATNGSISQYTFDVGTSATFIKFYLDFNETQPADGDLRVQVSVDNSNYITERVISGDDTLATINASLATIYYANIEISNPPRYVRLYNGNASQALTIANGIIEHGRR